MVDNKEYFQYKLDGIRTNKHVNFSWDAKDFGDDEACALADALMESHVVREIHLDGCNVGPRGMVALADAIKHNPTIKVLNLPNNAIGDEGAIALADAIRHLPDLALLICDANRYGLVGERAITNAIVGANLKNITSSPVETREASDHCRANFREARGAFQPFPLPDPIEPERLRNMAERWPAIERTYCNTPTLEVVEAAIAELPKPDLTQPDAVSALTAQQGDYRAMDNPAVWWNLDETVAALNGANMQLQADALLDEKGQPSEILDRAIGCGRARHLFTYENWQGASKAELQSVLAALPEESLIPNRQQLLATISREERQSGRGLG